MKIPQPFEFGEARRQKPGRAVRSAVEVAGVIGLKMFG